MKGKIAFVLGAAVGYVLGSRAGRERYEQIKRGAEQVWQTAPVQRGVDAVKDATRGTVENLKDSALRAGKNAFTALVNQQDRRSDAATPSARTASPAGRTADRAAATTANPRGATATSLNGDSGAADTADTADEARA
ncbi:hypothetical protein [Leucobacter japonicus]|uniref:hypothetical protein n=1 Tax=Leucobacter japonicus TaxID=1461259 RepID=UPI0006A7DE05|nr:hypothetical protein [Leucobacter japonicus]